MRYRRSWQAGGTFFFTVNLVDRTSTLLVDQVETLRLAVARTRHQFPFEILAWVVLPDHLHAVWTLPQDDDDNAVRWARIKSQFSRNIPCIEWVSASRRAKGERGLWQRRFWEHVIQDHADLQRHLDYVHINPVKHGHVPRPADWPYSSIHRYIAAGEMSASWAVEPHVGTGAGER